MKTALCHNKHSQCQCSKIRLDHATRALLHQTTVARCGYRRNIMVQLTLFRVCTISVFYTCLDLLKPIHSRIRHHFLRYQKLLRRAASCLSLTIPRHGERERVNQMIAPCSVCAHLKTADVFIMVVPMMIEPFQ